MAKKVATPAPFVEVRLNDDGYVQSSVVYVPPALSITHQEVITAAIANLQSKLLPDDGVIWTTGYLVPGKSNPLTRVVRRTWRRLRPNTDDSRWPTGK